MYFMSSALRAGEQSVIAKLAWALARLSLRDRACWQGVCHLVLRHVDALNSRELANVLWALASVRTEDQAVWQALTGRALLLVPHFNVQDISNTAWACAKVRRWFESHFSCS